MASTREVVTIQCGHYSNFIGAHWWNLQEAALWCPLLNRGEQDMNEIDYNCTFREGITLTGRETYTPRLIAIDRPGSLHSLKEDGTLYDESEAAPTPGTWGGPVAVFTSESNDKIEYQKDLDKMDKGKIGEEDMENKQYQLESDVRVWSDYLRPHLHPRTFLTVPSYHHNDERFDVWSAGDETWRDRNFRTDFEDRLHFFTEECDYLQGYQLLYDTNSGGFASLTASIVQYLQDEMSSKERIVFSATPTNILTSSSRQSLMHYILNSALGLMELWDSSSVLVPLSLASKLWPLPVDPLLHPSLKYDGTLPYHTSSILAAALETCTSLYRGGGAGNGMSSLAKLNQGRKVCSLSFEMPFDLLSTELFSSLLFLSPHCCHSNTARDLWTQSVCIRGNRDMPGRHGNTPSPDVWTTLTRQIYKARPSTNSQLSIYHQHPLVISTPYPSSIIADKLSSSLVATCSSLQCHSGVREFVDTLYDHTHKINPRQVPCYHSTCLDTDRYGELLSTLQDMSDSYRGSTIDEETSTDEEP